MSDPIDALMVRAEAQLAAIRANIESNVRANRLAGVPSSRETQDAAYLVQLVSALATDRAATRALLADARTLAQTVADEQHIDWDYGIINGKHAEWWECKSCNGVGDTHETVKHEDGCMYLLARRLLDAPPADEGTGTLPG